MEIDFLQWIGYLASAVVAISLSMSSILKFRWLNLFGAATFSTYGFLIGAMPVGFLNGFIVFVDIYFLIGIYSKKDLFETLEIRPDNKYLIRFLEFHDKEIQKFFPGFTYKPEMNSVSFFVLRNMSVAGLFLAHHDDEKNLRVGLDYVIPEYRDFKNGKFVYQKLGKRLSQSGYRNAIARGLSPKHIRYLKRLGFEEGKDGWFTKTLTA